VSFSRVDRVLIVGANSSISRALIEEIAPLNPRITLASRSPINDIKFEMENLIQFSLEDWKSVELFFEKIEGESFDFIYILTGSVSGLDISTSTLKEVQEYYHTYASSLNYLIGRLQGHLADFATMIFVSSRAAHRQSYDAHYSAVKASTEAFIKSIVRIFPTQRLLILAPSLIEDTRMYQDMTPENIMVHRKRTANQLLSLGEVVESILAMSNDSKTYLSGSTTCIGRDW
jgi:NAD(P)-dependent dehydrogenase (short-subunit alcohol dehydrogenase family)